MSHPSRLPATAYRDHLRAESDRFREVLAACDPAARVPACPDWDAADLLWHHAEVLWFWDAIVRSRPAGGPPDERRPRAGTYAGLLEQHAASAAALLAVLAEADPGEACWSWADHVPDGQTVGFTFRRQAHEAMVHRLDAEQTAGVPSRPLDPDLAADGVAELLEVMYGGTPPPWATFAPHGGTVRVEVADVGAAVVVQPGVLAGTDPGSGEAHDGPHLLVLDGADDDADGEPRKASATVRGTAATLDAWLWRRRDRAAVEVSGDEATLAAFAAATSPPLD